MARGKRADVVVDQGPETGFDPRLRIIPVEKSFEYEIELRTALARLQQICPGVGCKDDEMGYQITIPAAMHQGHEARFAEVLDRFLGYVDAGRWPQRVSDELVAKYTLLANARNLSHR